jgi:phosphate-selective porin OprO and OprP
MKQDLELKTNEIKALQEHMEEQEKTEVKLGDKGLEIATKDGNFKMAMGGRLQFDAQVNSGGQGLTQANTLNDGVGVRRGRIHTEGTLYKDFDFKFEYDFVRGNGSTAAGITDAWVEYTGLKPVSFTGGQFKEPFSLESVTSNRFLTFAERSLANNAFVEFANPYLLGVSAQSYGERWAVRAAFQAEPIGNGGYNSNTSLNNQGNANRNGVSGNPSYGPTARVTGLPYFNSKTELVHLGVSGSFREVNNSNPANFVNGAPNATAMRFASQIADVDRTNWADTGNLTNATHTLNNYYRVGAEVAGVYGPFSVQSEFMGTGLNGKGYSSGDFLYGYYATASYFLTGESRNYDVKQGKFNRQKANRNFSLKNGGWGAWELASRFDALDMNTTNVSGGKLEQATVALNWYLNPHVRMMLDYSHVLQNNVALNKTHTNTANYNSQAGSLLLTNGHHPNIFMLRTQIDW